jgi:hypothetical protein
MAENPYESPRAAIGEQATRPKSAFSIVRVVAAILIVFGVVMVIGVIDAIIVEYIRRSTPAPNVTFEESPEETCRLILPPMRIPSKLTFPQRCAQDEGICGAVAGA